MVEGQACVTPPSGLVSWWPADGNVEDVVNGNDGILRGDATFALGMVGQAFSFDGDGDFVEVPNAPNLNPTDQVTIDFWMKADPSNPMEACCQGLVITDFYGLEIAGGVGEVIGILFLTFADIQGAHSSDLSDGGFPIPPDEWHHFAGVYDGASVKLYADGQFVQEAPAFGSIPEMLPTSFLAIGSEDGRTNEPELIGERYFHGLIDEVELFNRALTSEEIQAIHDAGSAGKCKRGQGDKNTDAAVKVLQGIIKQVQALIDAGLLIADQGQPVIDAAQEAIDQLGG
jgi:hypothetical protein